MVARHQPWEGGSSNEFTRQLSPGSLARVVLPVPTIWEMMSLSVCVCVRERERERERERTANRYCPPPATIYSHDKCSTSILKQPWLEANPKSCQNFLSCSCAVPETENTTCKMQNWMEIWMLTCKVLRWTAASAYSALQYQCDHATTPLQPGQEKVAR